MSFDTCSSRSGTPHPSYIIRQSILCLAASLTAIVLGDSTALPARTSTLSISQSAYAPASRITPAPQLGYLAPQRLFGRQAAQSADPRFCAYVDGNGASPLYCDAGYTCTYLAAGVAFGCCNQRTCVNAPRTCFNDGESIGDCSSYPGLSPEQCTSIYLSVYTSVLFCTGNQPACQTYIFRTNTFDPQDTQGVPSWTCGASQTVIYAFANAITNSGAEINYSEGPQPTASGNNPSNPSPNQTQNRNPTNTSPSSTNTSSPTAAGNNKGVDTGTIIGAVVGAIGVLVTILVTLFPRQMTRLITCGLRPKKDYTNGEIRGMAWAYVTGQIAHTHTHTHTHTHVLLQSQPSLHDLQQHQPQNQQHQQMQWNQGQWSQGMGQQQGAYMGTNTAYGGYTAQPAPAYRPQAATPGHTGGHGQQGYSEYADYSPGYSMPQGYQLQEQRRPFLDPDERKL
ncbi:hypothetical protein ABW21_db0203683 [Orbilia brochopaga]|nr:hypothetical protein ABW21_db0203683 [Drechslerella brochopaga]